MNQLGWAWDDVMAAELALDESAQSQPLLDQVINAKPSRCVGFDGLDTATGTILLYASC